ncbi:MAG: hypothetical protein AAGI91_16160 [Bacteroidota bacterium]
MSAHLRLGLACLLATVILWGSGCIGSDTLRPHQGVDFDRLFAPPTDAEIAQVLQEWSARSRGDTYDPEDIAVEYDDDFFGDGSRLVILSHTVGGAPFTHYGAVRFPPGQPPEGGWPVVVYHHGGSNGLDLSKQLDRFVTGPLTAVGSRSVIVAPTYRSEPLFNTPIGDLVSGGELDPWDRDVDDAIALLNATLETFPDLLETRGFATLGASRGGAVSLLMAIRDERAQSAAVYFGPTDFFSPVVRQIAESYLADEPLEGFVIGRGATYLLEEVLTALSEGEISHDMARLELLKRSAARLAAFLPSTVAHHHECDPSVPFEQFEALERMATAIDGASEFYGYDVGCPDGALNGRFHSMKERVMPGNGERTAEFLTRSARRQR